jgi:hypothetical protein
MKTYAFLLLGFLGNTASAVQYCTTDHTGNVMGCYSTLGECRQALTRDNGAYLVACVIKYDARQNDNGWEHDLNQAINKGAQMQRVMIREQHQPLAPCPSGMRRSWVTGDCEMTKQQRALVESQTPPNNVPGDQIQQQSPKESGISVESDASVPSDNFTKVKVRGTSPWCTVDDHGYFYCFRSSQDDCERRCAYGCVKCAQNPNIK